jgi:general L-amino acid transport system permease protein
MSTHTFKPDMPPPNKVFGPMAWMRANLFSSWLNTLLTLLAFYLIYLVVPPILHWAILDANWVGTTRAGGGSSRSPPASSSSMRRIPR